MVDIPWAERVWIRGCGYAGGLELSPEEGTVSTGILVTLGAALFVISVMSYRGWAWNRRRTLRTYFGPEYDRAAWDHVQAGFLDNTATPLAGADQLIGNLLERVRDSRTAAVSTEDMRNVLMQYHRIFDELLTGTDTAVPAEPRLNQQREART
jgi:hypothetical protein